MDLELCVERYLASGFARAGEILGYWQTRQGMVCVLTLYQREPEALFELGVFKPDIGNWAHDLNGFTLSRPEVAAAVDGRSDVYGTDLINLPKVREVLRARIASLLPEVAAGRPVAQAAMRSVAGPVAVPEWRASRTTVFSLDAVLFEMGFLYWPQTMPSDAWQVFLQEAASDSESQEYLAELPAAVVQPEGAASRIAPVAAPLVWMACLGGCDARSVTLGSIDTLFADLAAERIDLDTLDSDSMTAWPIWCALVDVAAEHRAGQPWWLAATATATDSAMGLLPPHAVRLLARRIDELLHVGNEHGLSLDTEDRAALASFVREAAGQNRWLAGMEPGS